MTLEQYNTIILENHAKLVSQKRDFHSLVVQEFLKENQVLLIKEGLFDTLKNKAASAWQTGKYQLGKLGSLEKGGKIFGRGKASKQLSAEYEAAADKLAKQAVTKVFMETFKKSYPEFPNMKDEQQFQKAIEEIGKVYDAVVEGAVKKKTLDITEANAIIAALRSLVKVTLDRDLADVYKHFNESLLNEAEPVDYAKETGTMKGLSSTTAPKVLAALGALGLGFGWLVKQAWFKSMFLNPQTYTKVIKTLASGNKKGVTEHLAMLIGKPGDNISGMKVADFISNMKAHNLVDAAGNPTQNLLNLAKDAGNTNFATWWTNNLAGPAHAQQTLAQAIPLSGAGASGAGGDILTGKVVSHLGLAGGGGLSATGTALVGLGPLLSMLGIGAVLSGAAIYALRQKGLKSSRAQRLATLMNTMQDIDSGKKQDNVVDTGTQPTTPTGVERQPLIYVKKGGNKGRSLKINLLRAFNATQPLINFKVPEKISNNPNYKEEDSIKYKNNMRNKFISGLIDVVYNDLKQQGAVVQEEVEAPKQKVQRYTLHKKPIVDYVRKFSNKYDVKITKGTLQKIFKVLVVWKNEQGNRIYGDTANSRFIQSEFVIDESLINRWKQLADIN